MRYRLLGIALASPWLGRKLGRPLALHRFAHLLAAFGLGADKARERSSRTRLSHDMVSSQLADCYQILGVSEADCKDTIRR